MKATEKQKKDVSTLISTHFQANAKIQSLVKELSAIRKARSLVDGS